MCVCLVGVEFKGIIKFSTLNEDAEEKNLFCRGA